jgi:hypothetical protein
MSDDDHVNRVFSGEAFQDPQRVANVVGHRHIAALV